jgi:hypothetical protein
LAAFDGTRSADQELKGRVFWNPALGASGREQMRNKPMIEEKWRQQSEAAKNEAQKLPHGKEREALMRKARQLETASQLNQWLSSPELKAPE